MDSVIKGDILNRFLRVRVLLWVGVMLFLSTSSRSFAQKKENTRYRGVNFVLETGRFIGADRFDLNGFSPLSLVGGYTWNKHFFLGGGATIYHSQYYKFTTIPIFVRVKWPLFKSQLSPYLSVDCGYTVILGYPPTYERTENSTILDQRIGMGFYFRPEWGVLLRLKKRKAVHLGVGYMEQKGLFTRGYVEDGSVRIETRDVIGAITLRFGFTF